MLAALEIYNKPNFLYREETFAILSINSIELLFKAQLLKSSNYQIKSLQVFLPLLKKDGTPHKTRKKPKLSRSNNPVTIGLFDVIKKLESKGFTISKNHLDNIESLVELRDNAIHFHNGKFIAKEIQEIGFATIKNYLHIVKKWQLEVDLSIYNFYLMPLAYVDSKIVSSSVITDEVKNYLSFVKSKIDEQDKSDEEFDIAISIDINFSKANSFDGLPFNYDISGVPIFLTEQDIRKKFPITYKELTDKAKVRYSDFKQNLSFHEILNKVKGNEKLCHERRLDPNDPKSSKKLYYSSNIWIELDKVYTKAKKN